MKLLAVLLCVSILLTYLLSLRATLLISVLTTIEEIL